MSDSKTPQHNIGFDSFCELLLPLGALNSPAALHGTLCGKLCGGAQLNEDQCLQTASDALDLSHSPSGELNDAILGMQEVTQAQLDSGDYDLELFLPDDDSGLEEQTTALGQWCHGFLLGFGSAGIAPDTEFSSDHAGALKDLAAIVQAAVDEEEDSEEQQADFYELVEYVRVVALNFYEEHKAVSPESASGKSDSKPTLH